MQWPCRVNPLTLKKSLKYNWNFIFSLTLKFHGLFQRLFFIVHDHDSLFLKVCSVLSPELKRNGNLITIHILYNLPVLYVILFKCQTKVSASMQVNYQNSLQGSFNHPSTNNDKSWFCWNSIFKHPPPPLLHVLLAGPRSGGVLPRKEAL